MGCTATDDVIVVVDPVIATSVSIQPATCGYSNGTATVSVTGGGTGPFTYSWSTSPVQTTATATVLAMGTYYVTITDSQGCTKIVMANVNCITGIALHTSNLGISIVPNPSAGEFNLLIKGYKGTETTVNIFNIDGQCLYNEKLRITADVYSENINLSSFAKGVYYIRIMTAYNLSTLKLVTK
jgi:hypothetical protein